MERELDSLAEFFTAKYAPIEWKGELHGWNLEEQLNLCKEMVSPQTDGKEFQKIVRSFFLSPKDFHVGVSFISTESASLPLLVKTIKDKVIVIAAERNLEILPGDELIAIDGVPAIKVLDQFAKSGESPGTLSGRALSDLQFTNRKGVKGHEISRGVVQLIFQRSENVIFVKTLRWKFQKEEIASYPKSVEDSLQKLLHKQYIPPVCKMAMKFTFSPIGYKKSKLPPLGKVLWSFPSKAFDAYIFEGPNEKKIGFIRIPHYMGSSKQVEEFIQIIQTMEQSTEALVIDQLDNPGGNLFYLYALLSCLTDRPLLAPTQSEAITQREVLYTHLAMKQFEQIRNCKDAKQLLGSDIAGYPVTLELAESLKGWMKHHLSEWEQGHAFTSDFAAFGIEEISPHPAAGYSRPIILLINELDFSCGDLFPAILQDNHRAILVGERTAGAGGYVQKFDFPNLSGILSIHLTGSIMKRLNGKPIEDLGVMPDIPLKATQKDYKKGFKDYAGHIRAILQELP